MVAASWDSPNKALIFRAKFNCKVIVPVLAIGISRSALFKHTNGLKEKSIFSVTAVPVVRVGVTPKQ